VAEEEEVEGELGLQILRALFILSFLERFLVVFMVFLFQSPICLCCNRGVGGKWVEKGEGFWWSDGWMEWLWMRGEMDGLCRGAAWSWSAQGLFLYSRFWVSLLRRRGVVGSWWRQRVALLFRFSCLHVPCQPLSAIGFFLLSASFCYRLLSAIGFFLVPQDVLLHSWWLGLWFELL
jgi:hypothetical protein